MKIESSTKQNRGRLIHPTSDEEIGIYNNSV